MKPNFVNSITFKRIIPEIYVVIKVYLELVLTSISTPTCDQCNISFSLFPHRVQ